MEYNLADWIQQFQSQKKNIYLGESWFVNSHLFESKLLSCQMQLSLLHPGKETCSPSCTCLEQALRYSHTPHISCRRDFYSSFITGIAHHAKKVLAAKKRFYLGFFQLCLGLSLSFSAHCLPVLLQRHIWIGWTAGVGVCRALQRKIRKMQSPCEVCIR